MARFLKKSDHIIGKSPDELVFVGSRKLETPHIQVMDFTPESLEELETANAEELSRFATSETVSWISVYGLHDPAIISAVGEQFAIHPLALEDILNTGQLPKFEEYDDSLFLVLKLLFFEEESEKVSSNQFSMVVGPNYVITFHEEQVDLFFTVKERVRKQRGRSTWPNHQVQARGELPAQDYPAYPRAAQPGCQT